MLITPEIASEPYWAECPITQHFDAVDGRDRNRVDVGTGRTAADRLLHVHQRLLVAALAVDEHEHLVGPERTQGGRTKDVGTVADEGAGEIEAGSSICRICPTSCTPAWRSCSLVMMSTGAAVSAAVRPRAREPSTCTVSSCAGDVCLWLLLVGGGRPRTRFLRLRRQCERQAQGQGRYFDESFACIHRHAGLLLHVVVGALRAGGAPMRRP
jgi:hypothetical protein